MKRNGILAKSAPMLLPALGALVLALVAVPNAQAKCGVLPTPAVHPSSWHSMFGGAHLMRSSDREDSASIVGMWHVVFTADTSNGQPLGNPMVVDNALAVWHSDGTEIMNSGRPPQDGDFCMGVWKQTGDSNYVLNHFAWGGNFYQPGTANGVVGDPVGPVNYQEKVTLSPDGMSYSGTFTLTAYSSNDPTAFIAQTFTGTITATRITTNTTVGDLL